MEKLKRFTVLLVTAVLIVSCSRLPQLVTHMYAQKDTDQIQFESIPVLSLDLRKIPELTLLHKLYLVHYGDYIQISQDNFSMSASQSLSCAKEALEIYLGNGLIPDLPADSVEECIPLLYYSLATDLYCQGWQVNIHSTDYSYSAELFIDDETGNLLRIYFWCDHEIESFSSYDLLDRLDTFLEIFLGSMGMELPEDTSLSDYWDDGLSARCWWTAPMDGGEIVFSIEFFIFHAALYSTA